MEVSSEEFRRIVAQSNERRQLAEGVFMIRCDMTHSVVTTPSRDLIAFVVPHAIRHERVLTFLDIIYAIAQLFDYSVFGVPQEAFNYFICLMQPFAEEELGKQKKLAEIQAVQCDFKQLDELATEIKKQHILPLILQQQSVTDESQIQNVVVEPALVMGGVDSLVTYITNVPTFVKDQQHVFYNLIGNKNQIQKVKIRDISYQIATPSRENFFLFAQKIYLQNPYQVLYYLTNLPLKQHLEYLFWKNIKNKDDFGKLVTTKRKVYVPNRMISVQTYHMIDRFYLDIKNTQPFIQEIASGFKTLHSTDKTEEHHADHVVQWKLILFLLQTVHRLHYLSQYNEYLKK